MIDNIIELWNSNILIYLDDIDQKQHQAVGLTIPVVEQDGERIYPALVSQDGDSKYVFADDKFNIGIYHKLLNIDYTGSKTYGDRQILQARADLMLVCWGWLNSISAREAERIILNESPKDIQLLQSSFDRKQVFNSEFSGINFFLPADLFLFSIKYRVQYTVAKECK